MVTVGKLIWASPWTALGLSVGLLGLATGGHAQRRGRVIEFHGGAVTWLMERLPGARFAVAMTLGHTVLGRSAAMLDVSRAHELVHVRQYELWGPLFVPVYLLCSAVLWIRGKDPHRANPFERQAYDEAP
ncbi:MAG: hypothetical protein JXB62_18125 [Pirellulales bacterium]|nr:hypothetical protein [Pirellulales bacterium]